jgi:hypothetical protein
MTDKSASMMGSPWAQLTAAQQEFFGDPNSAGLWVAMRFYPTTDGCEDPTCSVPQCATPLVTLGQLTADYAPTDAQELALINGFGGVTPGGANPMSAALEGALSRGSTVAAGWPNERVAVVFTTDGEPTGCNLDETYITQAAGTAYTTAGVLTFPIGYLDDVDPIHLNAIAAAGGTGQARFVGHDNAQQDYLDALEEIRHEVRTCRYVFPDTPPPDPQAVNVQLTPPAGSPSRIGYVTGAAACVPGSHAWYYDNASSPAWLELCPHTCSYVRANPTASIEIEVGCPTAPL